MLLYTETKVNIMLNYLINSTYQMEKAKIINTEMLGARGYSFLNKCLDNDEFQDCDIYKKQDNDERIMVIYDTNEKINKNIVSKYTQLSENINNVILIYSGNITTMTLKLIDTLNESKNIELFHVDQLTFNITKHRLQPLFRRLVGGEKEEVIKCFGKNIPIINSKDAISRFYNYKKGDIIEITSKESVISYRFVK